MDGLSGVVLKSDLDPSRLGRGRIDAFDSEMTDLYGNSITSKSSACKPEDQQPEDQ
jgi:hypothetical protein